MHPLRRDTPDQKGCNAYGSGAPPPTTSPTAGTPSRHTTTGSIGRSHTPSKYSHRFHARAAAPDPSHCTRSVALHPIRRGVIPTDRVHRLPQQAQPRAIPPHRTQPSASDAATQLRNARQCSSAAIKETTHDRKTSARHDHETHTHHACTHHGQHNKHPSKQTSREHAT